MPVGGLATAAAPTFVEGMMGGLSFDLSGNLRTSTSFTPSGTQNVNLTQILGAAPSLTNPLWVFPATGAIFPISAVSLPLPALASTSTKQSDGSQKSQIVDGSGNVIAATANALNVNVASGSTQAPVAPATATATKSDLIGAQTTTAAVNPTNGQQSALSSDTNNNLLTSPGGAPNLATSQASVTTGNISVASARALRRSIKITNVTGTSAIYCGNTGVTTSTGDYLGSTSGSNLVFNTTAAVFCTVAATTQTVTIAETY